MVNGCIRSGVVGIFDAAVIGAFDTDHSAVICICKAHRIAVRIFYGIDSAAGSVGKFYRSSGRVCHFRNPVVVCRIPCNGNASSAGILHRGNRTRNGSTVIYLVGVTVTVIGTAKVAS